MRVLACNVAGMKMSEEVDDESPNHYQSIPEWNNGAVTIKMTVYEKIIFLHSPFAGNMHLLCFLQKEQ